MLLQLLSIYGITDQPDNFKKVYDSITAQNNPKSVASANELHSLYFEEPDQLTTQDGSTERQDHSEGLDFGLPTNQTDGSGSIHNDDITQNSDNAVATDTSTDNLSLSGDLMAADITVDNNQNDFDSTLSDLEGDLENGLNEPTTNTTPVTTLDDHENLSLPTNSDVATDLSEFDFGFDEPEKENNYSEQILTSNESGDAEYVEVDSVEMDSTEDNNDDFVLDFSDLEDKSEDNGFTQEDDSGLTLSFDDLDEPDDSGSPHDLESDLNPELQPEEPTVKAESDKQKSSSPLFDDNFLIDDDFDFDAFSENPTSAAPIVSIDPEDTTVESITSEEPSPIEEFSEQFSADFDFVRSLDNKQVTLDLADQYLQLGEYDSAKRLLKEVMAQGSIDQQRQAKAILNRTA
ncbi:FimV/HubP family polar landmark protein [Psychrobacter sp.]|uniref:FimV/HubP family polar landmark protein n=1 Tax=Psychrobacter sp. TaxID=56811 RepID=UPI00264971F0|nr:FimV/HubP family polar landmark protein [Psychrobacter sp.]MDN6276347.1 hypothetical protein [Psychrobacter sp.]MDN6308672.1 hypothetical protein [Psychrobacter sp.]